MRTITFLLSGALALAASPPNAANAQEQPAPEAEDEGAGRIGTASAHPEGEAAGPAAVEPAAGKPAAPRCLAEPVVLKRFGVPEPLVVSLTDCESNPNPLALPLVSALALSRQAQPEPPPARADGGADPDRSALADPPAAPDALLNLQLLERLQRLASRFPDRAIEIVSGYRTRARPGSRHRTGDALDVRIEGVDNEELSIFARTLEATGVGYYPNSTFVHVDVRAASAYWVDRSGPGERPDYVRGASGDGSEVPTRAEEVADGERAAITAEVERALREALEEVHGPELPVADESEPLNATVAQTVAPGASSEATAAQPSAGPATAELVTAAATEGESAASEETTSAGAATPVEPEPAHAQSAGAAPVHPAELDAEIKSLLERALVVMRQAKTTG